MATPILLQFPNASAVPGSGWSMICCATRSSTSCCRPAAPSTRCSWLNASGCRARRSARRSSDWRARGWSRPCPTARPWWRTSISCNMHTFFDAITLMYRVTTRLAAQHHRPADLAVIRAHQAGFAAAARCARCSGDDRHQRNSPRRPSPMPGGIPISSVSSMRILDEGRRILRLYYQSYDDRLPLEYVDEHEEMIAAIATRDIERCGSAGQAPMPNRSCDQIQTASFPAMGQRDECPVIDLCDFLSTNKIQDASLSFQGRRFCSLRDCFGNGIVIGAPRMVNAEIFSGVIPALMTPCRHDRSPDFDALVRKGKQLIAGRNVGGRLLRLDGRLAAAHRCTAHGRRRAPGQGRRAGHRRHGRASTRRRPWRMPPMPRRSARRG